MSPTKRSAKKTAVHPAVAVVPSMWTIQRWPKDVFPFSARAGKRLCLEHRDSLIAALVLSRPGREIVVHGAAFVRWLEGHAGRVADYQIAPNEKADA